MTDFLKQFLRLRGVHTPCEKCRGLGVYHYSSGATWRGGMGTCAFTYDICDTCWGTGDKHRIGTDIRKLEEQRKDWEENQCLEYLARRTGANFKGMCKRIQQLSDLCFKQANKRKIPDGEGHFWWNLEWDMLGKIFASLVKEK